ncbi:MAG: BamA/TamA family outer membrane protein [Kofleriaceae bacterium]
MLAKLSLVLALSIACGRTCSSAFADDAPGADPPSTAPGNTTPIPAPPPLRRAPTGTFQLGVGYSTDDSFGASASVTQSDLFGTGKLLSLDAVIDGREQKFVTRFVDPELFGSGFELDAQLVSDNKHLDAFTRESVGTNLELSHLVGPHTKWYAGYRLEHVTEAFDDPVLHAPSYDLAALRVGSELDTLDQPFLATRGSRLGSMLELAAPGLGGQVSMVHTHTYAETHQQLGAFLVHLSGSLETVSGHNLPAGEMLYFDGSSQIRGYAPNAVGPHGSLATGFGRAELELPVVKRIGLSVTGFADGGVLSNSIGGELAASTGFGVVWRSPIGPIGGYWAWTADHGPAFVFGAGAQF